MKIKLLIFLTVLIAIICSVRLLAATNETYTGEMITIPAGSFLMGNSGIGDDSVYNWDNEKPQHSVYLDTYQIGKYEVTRGEYRKFIDADGYNNSAYWSTAGWTWKLGNKRTEPSCWKADQNWKTGTFTQTDNHPVAGVTYHEAEAYCKWAGGRLPSEAEWEKAARWNVITQHPNIYPWGDVWDFEKCNNLNDHNSAGGGFAKHQTAPVGSYKDDSSPYGCKDMAGNVFEWCADWYKSYPDSTKPIDRTNADRVLRGGDSFGKASFSRCASRYVNTPYDTWHYRGFRFAR